jgi:hypothetical protein
MDLEDDFVILANQTDGKIEMVSFLHLALWFGKLYTNVVVTAPDISF